MRRDGMRERLAAARRALSSPGVAGRALRAWAEIRRRPDAIVAFVLGAGVLAMVLHWG
jgi:hypothetical protein